MIAARITRDDGRDPMPFTSLEAARAEYLRRVRDGQPVYLEDGDGNTLSAWHDGDDWDDQGAERVQAWPNEDAEMEAARGIDP